MVGRKYKLRWYHRYENVFFPGNDRVVASSGYIFPWTGKIVRWWGSHVLRIKWLYPGENRRIVR